MKSRPIIKIIFLDLIVSMNLRNISVIGELNTYYSFLSLKYLLLSCSKTIEFVATFGLRNIKNKKVEQICRPIIP